MAIGIDAVTECTVVCGSGLERQGAPSRLPTGRSAPRDAAAGTDRLGPRFSGAEAERAATGQVGVTGFSRWEDCRATGCSRRVRAPPGRTRKADRTPNVRVFPPSE
jgi:hypothetical protein